MAFPVDYTTTIDDVTIQCSKPFNELGDITVNDLLPYAISGIHDIGVGRASLSCESFNNYTDVENNTPVEYINSAWSDVRVKYHTEYNPFRANPHYGFTILAYGSEWQCINSTTDNARLVLDIPIQKIFVEMPTYSKQTINKVNDGDVSTVDSIDWYTTSDIGKIRTVSNNTEISNLQILTVFVLSDSNFIIMNTTGQKGAPFVHTTYAWHGNTGNASGGTSGTTVFLPYYSTTYLGNTARYVNMANDDALNNNTFGNVDWSRYFTILFDTPDNEHEQTNSYVVITYTGAGPPDFNGTVTFYPKGGERSAMLGFANSCLKFKYGLTMYKPLISGGAVYDYTDDMDAESEFDDITTVTGNNVPITPPAPPTPQKDDIDDHKMGAGTGISGMANLWLLTKAQLESLHTAFNSAPAGFDPMNSLISVMGLGVAPTYLFNDIQYITPINIRKSDGTSWSTGVEGHIVDAQKSAFQFTGITVNRKYNNFLDFSPYAIHEIFIPMCGWLTLPDIAVDRSITVTYLPDVESLKCRAVVSVVDNSGNRCVIGEKDGIMGADVPFTNTGHSLYVGEAIINGMNVAGEVITGAIGAGFTKTNAKGGTYRPYEGFTVGMAGTLPGAIGNALVSGQTNRTHYMTGNGTRIGFSDGENIQIKSTYHNIDKPRNYDHTVGKVCNKTGELSDFKGFTVCDNPHITFSALEDEKEEIKRLLEQGVIL